jgi:hypothetical protein
MINQIISIMYILNKIVVAKIFDSAPISNNIYQKIKYVILDVEIKANELSIPFEHKTIYYSDIINAITIIFELSDFDNVGQIILGKNYYE